MMLTKTKVKIAVLAAAVLATTPVAAFAESEPRHAGGAFGKFLGGIKGQAQKIDRAAMEVYESVPRSGSCAERRERILAMLPDALRFSRYASDIYYSDHGSGMKAANLTSLNLGDGRSAYYDAAGSRYAEVRVDPERHQVAVVFRGTRPSVRSDVSTDALSFIGYQTAYYDWADWLVAKVVGEHPGMEVVATGHSLGGGLALHAVRHNPGVKGFVFNPAGLSLLTWARTNSSKRAQANAAITVISTRNADHIEPVTAISLAGMSVLPGHIFVLEAQAIEPRLLHSDKTIVAAIEAVASANAEGSACEGDLGVMLAH